MNPCRAHPQRRRCSRSPRRHRRRHPLGSLALHRLAPPAPCPFTGPARPRLDQRGIPDQALIDALAAVVWVTWAVLVASIAVEVPAALAGRRAPGSRSPGSSNRSPAGSSPAVIVAALSFAPRTTQVTALGSLGGGLSTLSRQPVATLVLTGATQPLLATSKPAAADLSMPDAATASTNSSRTYVFSAATRSGASPSDSSATRWIGRRSTSSTRAGPSPTGAPSPTRTGSIPVGHSCCRRRARACGRTRCRGHLGTPRHKSVPTSTTSPTRGNGTGGAAQAYASAQ